MKKIIRPGALSLLIPALGCFGGVLRLWQITAGLDDKGLFAHDHLSGILIPVLTVLTAAIIFQTVCGLRDVSSYSRNFPASLPGAVGTAAAAVGIILTGASLLGRMQILLDAVCGVLGLVAGAALLLSAYNRLQGSKVSFLLHAPVCLFLGLWLFTRCRIWGAEPEIWWFLPDMMATVCLMIAACQLTAFDVNLGKRGTYLFWNLMAGFLCITALPGSDNKLLLFCCAVWMFTNPCSMKLPRKAERCPEPEQAPVGEESAGNLKFEPAAPEMEDWMKLIQQLENEEKKD